MDEGNEVEAEARGVRVYECALEKMMAGAEGGNYGLQTRWRALSPNALASHRGTAANVEDALEGVSGWIPLDLNDRELTCDRAITRSTMDDRANSPISRATNRLPTRKKWSRSSTWT